MSQKFSLKMNHNTTIEVKKGEEFKVVFSIMDSSGFGHNKRSDIPYENIQFLNARTKSQTSRNAGGSSQEVVTLKALKKGVFDLEFTTSRAHNHSDPGTIFYEVEVVVE